MNTTGRDVHVPQWFWLWFPIILYFGHFVVRALASDDFIDQYMLHESGFTEQFTVAVTALALIFGLIVLARFSGFGWKGRLFFLIFCLGCFYFAGEEASWGQHWFGWGTPEEWQSLNHQDETNFHNMEGVWGDLFDQLPRLLLGLAAFIGGGLLPLIRRARGKHYARHSLAYWIMPGLACVPIGFIASLASMPKKIGKALGDGDIYWLFDIHLGELKELMIGTFLFIYIASIWIRLRQA